jgi:hypothetical protein
MIALRSGAFRECLSHEGYTLMNGISVLIIKAQENFFDTSYVSSQQAITRHGIYWHLDLEISLQDCE